MVRVADGSHRLVFEERRQEFHLDDRGVLEFIEQNKPIFFTNLLNNIGHGIHDSSGQDQLVRKIHDSEFTLTALELGNGIKEGDTKLVTRLHLTCVFVRIADFGEFRSELSQPFASLFDAESMLPQLSVEAQRRRDRRRNRDVLIEAFRPIRHDVCHQLNRTSLAEHCDVRIQADP